MWLKYSVAALVVREMGVFEVKTKVWRVGEPASAREVKMVVDTGATYTTLPASLLREMGVRPIRKRKLRLANGKVVERDLAEIGLEVQGESIASTYVIFGNEGISLLGSFTLEGLSLAADSVRKELVPTEAYLLSSGT